MLTKSLCSPDREQSSCGSSWDNQMQTWNERLLLPWTVCVHSGSGWALLQVRTEHSVPCSLPDVVFGINWSWWRLGDHRPSKVFKYSQEHKEKQCICNRPRLDLSKYEAYELAAEKPKWKSETSEVSHQPTIGTAHSLWCYSHRSFSCTIARGPDCRQGSEVSSEKDPLDTLRVFLTWLIWIPRPTRGLTVEVGLASL